MLFERAKLTPAGRLEAIERLFESFARREQGVPEPGHVPVEALEAYGAFETPVRHMLEAACARTKDRTLLRQLRKIERELNALPESLMATLCAEPKENWLDFYRRLLNLHKLMAEVNGDTDPEEYEGLLRRMAVLAGTVSRHSRVRIEAPACFTLMLMQVELDRQHPKSKLRKRKKTVRKKKPAAKKN